MTYTSNRRLSPEALVAIIMTILVFPMAFITTLKLFGHNFHFLRDLGFLSGPRGTLVAWTLAFLVAAAYIAFAVKGIPSVARTWRQVSWLKALMFIAAIAAATVEEAFFRRAVMDGTRQLGGGVILQILASAAAFGMAHSIWGLIKRDLLVAARTVLATGIMGGLLAIVYVAGERSLAPCIVAHFLITFALEPGLLLAAVTGEWRSAPGRPNQAPEPTSRRESPEIVR
jgi:CAAX protease family protein